MYGSPIPDHRFAQELHRQRLAAAEEERLALATLRARRREQRPAAPAPLAALAARLLRRPAAAAPQS